MGVHGQGAEIDKGRIRGQGQGGNHGLVAAERLIGRGDLPCHVRERVAQLGPEPGLRPQGLDGLHSLQQVDLTRLVVPMGLLHRGEHWSEAPSGIPHHRGVERDRGDEGEGQRHRVRDHQGDGNDEEKDSGCRLDSLLDDEPTDVRHSGDPSFQVPGASTGEIRHGQVQKPGREKVQGRGVETHGDANEDPALQIEAQTTGGHDPEQRQS